MNRCLFQKFAEKWYRKNKQFIFDIQEIWEKILMFHFKYGIDFEFKIKSYKEQKERDLKFLNNIENISQEKINKMTGIKSA